MAKSFKFKNNMYLDLSGIWVSKENLTLNKILRQSDFSIITGSRINQETNVKYWCTLGCGFPDNINGKNEHLSSVAIEMAGNGVRKGRLDVCSNGEIWNFVTQSKMMEESYKKIEAKDFFASTAYTPVDCFIYQVGNLINIVRLTFLNVPKKTSDILLGTINEKYRPVGKTPVRFLCSTGGNLLDGISILNTNSQLYISNTTTNTGTGGVYFFNTTYVINPIK